MPATPSQMAQSEPDLYAVLGVAKSASASEIKVSYRRLALLHHPDKNNNSPEATQQFQQVALAFKVLSDPKARKYYDKTGTTEGIDVSPEDFLADFYAIMQEMMGDFSVKDMLEGLGPEEIAELPPFPFPKELFPPGTFPPELRFSSEGLAGIPPAVEELLASGDTSAITEAMFASAAQKHSAWSGTDSEADDDDDGPARGRFPGAGRKQHRSRGPLHPPSEEEIEALLQQLQQQGLLDASGLDSSQKQELMQMLMMDLPPGGLQGLSSSSDGAGDDHHWGPSVLDQRGAASPGAPQQQQAAARAGSLRSLSSNDGSINDQMKQRQAGSSSSKSRSGFAPGFLNSSSSKQQAKTKGKPSLIATAASASAPAAAPSAARHASSTASQQEQEPLPRQLLQVWMEAAKAGEVPLLQELLAQVGPRLLVQQQGALGHTAAHWAAAKGEAAALRWLLQQGADVNMVNNTGSMALHAAAANGHAACVKVLLGWPGAAPEVVNEDGLTAAALAAKHGHAALAESLRSSTAKQQAGQQAAAGFVPAASPPSDPGQAPAAAAAQQGPAAATPEHAKASLPQQPAASPQQGGSGGTSMPGPTAASQGPAAGPAQLAEEPEPVAPAATAPAAAAPQQDAAAAPTRPQTSPPAVAPAVSSQTQSSTATPSTDIKSSTQATTEASAPASSTTQPHTPTCGNTGASTPAAAGINAAQPAVAPMPEPDTGRAWLLAAKQGSLASLQQLLQQHPGLLLYQGQGTSYGFSGNSALHWAAAKGHGACTVWLLQQGADVHLRNNAGSTVLHSAVNNRQQGTAKVLVLQGGADVSALDCFGESPRSLARQQGAGGAALPEQAVQLELWAAAVELRRAGERAQWPVRAMRVLLECSGQHGSTAVGLDRAELQEGCAQLLQQLAVHPRAAAAGPAPALPPDDAQGSKAGGQGAGGREEESEAVSSAEQQVMQQRAETAKQRGNQAFAAKDYKRAVAQYTIATRLLPGNAVLHSNRSAAYASLGDWSAALRDGHKCLEIQPGWPKGMCRVAAAYLGMGQYKEALKGFRQALAVDSEYAAAKQGVSECMAQMRGS